MMSSKAYNWGFCYSLNPHLFAHFIYCTSPLHHVVNIPRSNLKHSIICIHWFSHCFSYWLKYVITLLKSRGLHTQPCGVTFLTLYVFECSVLTRTSIVLPYKTFNTQQYILPLILSLLILIKSLLSIAYWMLSLLSLHILPLS